MTQSLAVYEDIRKNINLIEEIQHQEVDEAVLDTVKNVAGKAGAWWAARHQRSGASDLKDIINQNFQWLGKLMGKQGLKYETLNFGHMRNFLKKESMGLTDSDVNQIFDKIQQEFKLPDTKDDTVLSADQVRSQNIIKSLLNQGIILGRSKQSSLGSASGGAQTASSTATSTASAPKSNATTPPASGLGQQAVSISNMTPQQQQALIPAIQMIVSGSATP